MYFHCTIFQCLHVRVTSHSLEFEYLDVYREDGATVEDFVYYTVPVVRLAGAVNAEKTNVGVRSGGSGSHTVVIYSSKQPGALTLTTNESSYTSSQAISVNVSSITF